MSNVVISVEHLSKSYGLNQIGPVTVNLHQLLYSFGFMLIVVFIGSVIINRVGQTFMDTV